MDLGFPLRSSEDFRSRAKEWLEHTTPAAKAAHFKEYGARWFEFARLPYFDPVRMTVIDPMHNILLGAFIIRLPCD